MALLRCLVIVLITTVAHQWVIEEFGKNNQDELPKLEATPEVKSDPQQANEQNTRTTSDGHRGVSKPNCKIHVNENQEIVFPSANNLKICPERTAEYPDESIANNKGKRFKQRTCQKDKYYEECTKAEEGESAVMDSGHVEYCDKYHPKKEFKLISLPESFKEKEGENLKYTKTCQLLPNTFGIKDNTDKLLGDVTRTLQTSYQAESTTEERKSELQTEEKRNRSYTGNEQRNMNLDHKMEGFLSQEKIYKDSKKEGINTETKEKDFHPSEGGHSCSECGNGEFIAENREQRFTHTNEKQEFIAVDEKRNLLQGDEKNEYGVTYEREELHTEYGNGLDVEKETRFSQIDFQTETIPAENNKFTIGTTSDESNIIERIEFPFSEEIKNLIFEEGELGPYYKTLKREFASQTVNNGVKHLTTEEKMRENSEFNDMVDKAENEEEGRIARIEKLKRRIIRKLTPQKPLFKDLIDPDPESEDFEYGEYFNDLGEEFRQEELKYKIIDENVENVMEKENIPREEAERFIRIQKLKRNIFRKIVPTIYYHRNLRLGESDDEDWDPDDLFVDWSKENVQKEEGMDETKSNEQNQDEIKDNVSREKKVKSSRKKVDDKNDDDEFTLDLDEPNEDTEEVDWENGKDFPEGAEEFYEDGLQIDNVKEFVKWRIGRLIKMPPGSLLKYKSKHQDFDPTAFMGRPPWPHERDPREEYRKIEEKFNSGDLFSKRTPEQVERVNKIRFKSTYMEKEKDNS